MVRVRMSREPTARAARRRPCTVCRRAWDVLQHDDDDARTVQGNRRGSSSPARCWGGFRKKSQNLTNPRLFQCAYHVRVWGARFYGWGRASGAPDPRVTSILRPSSGFMDVPGATAPRTRFWRLRPIGGGRPTGRVCAETGPSFPACGQVESTLVKINPRLEVADLCIHGCICDRERLHRYVRPQ